MRRLRAWRGRGTAALRRWLVVRLIRGQERLVASDAEAVGQLPRMLVETSLPSMGRCLVRQDLFDPVLQEVHVLVSDDAVGRSMVPEIGHFFPQEAALAGVAFDGEYAGVVLGGRFVRLQLGAPTVRPVGCPSDWHGG